MTPPWASLPKLTVSRCWERDCYPDRVFVSYASQDFEAARRISDALRTAGVSVWIDQSELPGGTAWDHEIRQRIRNCALFLPILSANTASRLEGYFRLEWTLAEQRSQMIARNQTFIVPVCSRFLTNHPL